MKSTVLAAAVSLVLVNLALAPSVFATSQQEKMTACNKEAGDKKLQGDERKKFMSECLSAKPAGEKAAGGKPAATSQQERMKACNKEAGDKKLQGDERKKFMSECLKG